MNQSLQVFKKLNFTLFKGLFSSNFAQVRIGIHNLPIPSDTIQVVLLWDLKCGCIVFNKGISGKSVVDYFLDQGLCLNRDILWVGDLDPVWVDKAENVLWFGERTLLLGLGFDVGEWQNVDCFAVELFVDLDDFCGDLVVLNQQCAKLWQACELICEGDVFVNLEVFNKVSVDAFDFIFT